MRRLKGLHSATRARAKNPIDRYREIVHIHQQILRRLHGIALIACTQCVVLDKLRPGLRPDDPIGGKPVRLLEILNCCLGRRSKVSICCDCSPLGFQKVLERIHIGPCVRPPQHRPIGRRGRFCRCGCGQRRLCWQWSRFRDNDLHVCLPPKAHAIGRLRLPVGAIGTGCTGRDKIHTHIYIRPGYRQGERYGSRPAQWIAGDVDKERSRLPITCTGVLYPPGFYKCSVGRKNCVIRHSHIGHICYTKGATRGGRRCLRRQRFRRRLRRQRFRRRRYFCDRADIRSRWRRRGLLRLGHGRTSQRPSQYNQQQHTNQFPLHGASLWLLNHL